MPPGAADSSGRPLAGQSRGELLDGIVESILLAKVAADAGVVVTEAEVTQAIEAGIVLPMADRNLPAEHRAALTAWLHALNVATSAVTADPAVRDSYRRFLIVQRHASAGAPPRSERLAAAKSAIPVQIFPERLSP